MVAEAGEDVVEVPGARRARAAKNDRIDAVQAARTALAREQQATPRARGLREALRQILVTRRAVLVSRTKAINELKSLIVVAPEHLRAGLRGMALVTQLDRIEALTSPAGAGVEHRVTVWTLRSIATRIRFLFDQTAELDRELLTLVHAHPAGPALLAEPGVGPVSAAQLLVSWSHRGRVRSEAAFAALAGVAPLEASSGQRIRHRLNHGGTGTSTGRCTPSRSLGCAATRSLVPSRPDAPRRARPTATSAAASSALSPAGSTGASKPSPDPWQHAPPS